MTFAFHPLPTAEVAHFRQTARDAYGNAPVRTRSTGRGAPCRHCLKTVPKDAGMLILSWRPFADPSPYAETGPIFLCEAHCAPAQPSDALPEMLTGARYVLLPYDTTPKIRYGHERLVPTGEITAHATETLDDPETAFIDLRNPVTGCYQCRIRRA